MALTTVSKPVPIVSAIGSNHSITFSVSSPTALGGQDIYVLPGQFLQANKPSVTITSPPADSYSFTYPPVNTTIILSKNSDPTLHILSVYATIKSQTLFDLTINFLFKADREAFDSGSADNIDHFEKSSLLTAAFYTNTRPTVYNRTNRVLRTEVVQFSGTSAVSQLSYDTPVQARFWCEELQDCGECLPDGCLLSVLDNYTFDLFRSGMMVTGLSAYEDTTLRLGVDLGTGTIDSFSVAIYRRDTSTSNTNYWTDLDMGYSVYNPTQNGVSPLQLGPFPTGSYVFTLSTGTTYTVDLLLNQTYFSLGGEYRFFVVINTSEGIYSCYSPLFIADDPPEPVYGTVTAVSYDYSSGNNAYGDCIVNAACGERLKLCVEMDEQEYNDNIFAFKTVGTFADNFESLGITVLDRRPFEPDCFDGTIDPIFTLESTATGGCGTFRIPDDWAGTTKYVVFTYVFRLVVNNFEYRDRIYKYFRIVTGNLSTDLTAVLTDDQGAPVTERICDSYSGDLTLTTTNAQGAAFDHIALIRRGTGDWQEEDDYLNNNLPQLDVDALAADPDFVGGDAVTTIDPTGLSINQEYCLKIIAKEQSTTTVNPVPDVFDMTFTLTASNVVTAPEGEIYVRYTFDWATAYAGTFDQIDIVIPNPDTGSDYLNHTDTVTSGNVDFENFSAGTSNVYNVQIFIRLPNTVEYTAMFTMTINNMTGNSVFEIVNFS